MSITLNIIIIVLAAINLFIIIHMNLKIKRLEEEKQDALDLLDKAQQDIKELNQMLRSF